MKQVPGNLPRGATLDSLLTPEEFCIWQKCGRDWFASRSRTLPGIVRHSKKHVRIHPRSYLETSVKTK